MTSGRPLIVDNWKMHRLAAALTEIEESAATLSDILVRAALCPPPALLHPARAAVASRSLTLVAQDCNASKEGAFKGAISAQMVANWRARYVVLGHSERR
jgi:triosephosphate isomerase (TIM)